MKRQKKGMIFILIIVLCSGILAPITWNSLEKDDIIVGSSEFYDEQFYIDCLENLIGMPIAAAGYDNPLNYSTFIGGSSDDYGRSIVIDADGSAYITGYTTSSSFITTTGAFDETHNGKQDIFVCKLSADGSTLVYSTFIGGTEYDYGYSIALGADGSVYIIGDTDSSNFNITTGAFNESFSGARDVFVCMLSMDGSTLNYSTFIGGSDWDYGRSIAIDTVGCAYITGDTFSTDFPTTTGAFDETFNGGQLDLFTCKLSANGSTLDYSTFIGGWANDHGYSNAVDASGNVYITGTTQSNDFSTTTGAFDETHNGGRDGLACKLSADGSTLIYSTFIGGSNDDDGISIAIDADENAYITGCTRSSNFNTTMGAFDETHNGDWDVFICRLSADGSILVYSTYIGGDDWDIGYSIDLDSEGSAYITGVTYSSDFNTTTGTFDETYNGGDNDVFMCKLSSLGSTLVYSTFIGGSDRDNGYGIVVDSEESAYITGFTRSSDFKTTSGAFKETKNSGWDTILSKFNKFPDPPGPFSLASLDAGSPDNDGQFTMNWGISAGADNYTVYWDTTSFTTYTGAQNILIDELDVNTAPFSTSQNGTYYFRICAKNGTGERYSDSGCLQIVVGLPPPGIFSLISPDAGSPDNDGQFTLNWGISEGADNYSVYWDTVPFTTYTGAQNILINELDVNTAPFSTSQNGTYYFRVCAKNGTGERYSDAGCLQIVVGFPPPGPFSLSSPDAGSPDDDGQFNLNWGTSEGADNYTVYWDTTSFTTFTGTQNILIDEIDVNTAPFSTSQSGIYYFRVCARNGTGERYSDAGCLQIVIAIPPGVFSLNSPDAGSPDNDGQFTLNWGTSEGADNYTVYWDITSFTTFTGAQNILIDEIDVNTAPFSTSQNGTYYFRVCAKNRTGERYSSAGCLQIVVALPPPGPFSLTSPDAGSPDDDGQFTLNWGISEGADNYTVYWDTTSFTTFTGAQNILINELDVNTAPFSTSQNGTYYFRVCARNGTGERYSGAVCLPIDVIRVPPGPFSLTSPDAGSPDNDGQFTLNWDTSEGADNYTVYWDTISFTTFTGAQNILIDELDVNTTPFSTSQEGTYYFRVFARNINGETYSGSGCLPIVVALPPPGPFSLASPDAGSPDDDGQFTLNWDTSDGADNYTVYWDTASFTTYTGSQNILIEELDVNTAPFSTLQNATYYFRVCAKNMTGERYSDSGCLQIIVAIPPPGPFSLSSPDAGSPDDDGKFTLIWSLSFNADNYTLYMSLNTDFTVYNGSQEILVNERYITSYSVTLTQNGTYYFRVCAKNCIGEMYSNLSTILVLVQIKATTNDDEDGVGGSGVDLFLLTVLLGILAVISIIIPATILQKKRKKIKANGSKSDVLMESSRLNEIPYVYEEQQQFSPPKGPEYTVYCTNCNSPSSITRNQFYNFNCKECGKRIFNVGYFCRNCNQVYPVSRHDFINLQEIESLRCYTCNNEMKLLKSEEPDGNIQPESDPLNREWKTTPI